MDREKRSSKFLGSRLSSIFASLDSSQHQQEHHQARSIHSKLSSGSLNPLAKTPLSNTSSSQLSAPSFPKGVRHGMGHSSEHSSNKTSFEERILHDSINSPVPTRKLTRKPPPPDGIIDSSSIQRNQELNDGALLLNPTELSVVGKDRSHIDGLDDIIGTLEDEIHQMMKPSYESFSTQYSPAKEGNSGQYEKHPDSVVSDDTEVYEHKNSIEHPDLPSASKTFQKKMTSADWGSGVSQPTSQSDGDDAGYENLRNSSSFIEKNKSFLSGIHSPNHSDANQFPKGMEAASISGFPNAHASLASVDSLHFLDAGGTYSGEPLHTVETTGSSLRSNVLSTTDSQFSISLPNRIVSYDSKGTPESSSRAAITSSHSVNYEDSSSLPQSTYPTELLHEVLTTGTGGGSTANNLSNPALGRAQPSTRSIPTYSPRTPLKTSNTFTSIASDASCPKGLPSMTSANTFHRKSLSMSSIFSSNSNRHITLGTLKKSITLRPGEGERSNYVQSIRRNAGTSYNDLGPETWKLPVGILPVDKRQLLPTNDRYNRLRGNRKNQSSGVGLKHGHLAPRLLAAEVDESEGLNKFGSLGRSSTFQRHDKKDVSAVALSRLSIPSTVVSRGNLLRQNSNAPSRAGSIAGSFLSSIMASTDPSTPKRNSGIHNGYQPMISRHALTSSRMSVGSISDGRLVEGYYQHPGYRYEEEVENTEGISPSTERTMHHDSDEDNDEKPRLVLANPDSDSSDD